MFMPSSSMSIFHLGAGLIASRIGEVWADWVVSTLPNIERAPGSIKCTGVWQRGPLQHAVGPDLASDAGSNGWTGMYGALDVLEQMPYSLFYLSVHVHARMAAYAPSVLYY
ncbi:hypothetical protein EDB85DRAFT_273577 [Lactarius pseudohatsudake]|nr:hypothetical protein EDB85DRAFT_273577 [Lactarius pseudohatsudake]